MYLRNRHHRVLEFIGPDFRPVSTSEIAEVRGTKKASAANLVRELTRDESCARKLAAHLWAITSLGQKILKTTPSADGAYLQWLYILCDTLSESNEEEAFAIDAFRKITWRRNVWGKLFKEGKTEVDPDEWPKLAFYIVCVLARSEALSDPKLYVSHKGPALDAFRQAVFAVREKGAAAETLEIVKKMKADFSRRGILKAKPKFDWMVRHLEIVLKGKPYATAVWKPVSSSR